MEDNLTIDDQNTQQSAPPQQQDPPNKKLWQTLYNEKLYTKTYDEFKNQFSTPEAVDKLHKTLYDEQLYTKDGENFKTQFFGDVLKKKGSTQDGGISSSPLQSQLKGDDAIGEPSDLKVDNTQLISDGNELDPIQAVKNSDELRNKKVTSASNAELGGDYLSPDADAAKTADQIDKDLKSKGYSQDFFEGVKDLPEEAFSDPNTSKQALTSDYKNNPLLFGQKVNEAKNHWAIRKSVEDNFDGTPEQKREAGINAVNAYTGDIHPQSFSDFENIIKNKQDVINQTLPTTEDKQKANERLQSAYSSYINPYDKDIQEEYNSSPLKAQVDPSQFAGLKTLQLFDPAKYEQYVNILNAKITPQFQGGINITPDEQQKFITSDANLAAKNNWKPTQLTINEQIGKENVLRELNNMGLQNTAQKINYDQAELIKQNAVADTPEDKLRIANEFTDNKNKLAQLNDLQKQDDTRYPLTAQLKFDQQAKDITQNRGRSVLDWMWNKYTPYSSMVDATENIATSLFGSDADKAKLALKRGGEMQNYQASTYLPENERSLNSPFVLQASKELKSKVNKILNGRSLSSLSDDEKNNLNALIKNNQDQIETVTNPEAGQSKNFLSKATGMSIAGFTTDMASFMTQMGALKGLGVGSKIAEATSLFTPAYNEAFNKKIEEGKSVDEANSYGILHGGVMALMSKFGSKYEAVQNVLKGGKSPISQEIAGMGKEAWDAIYKENKPFIERLGNSAKGVAKENAKMIGTFGVAAPVANDLADNAFYDKQKSAGEIGSDIVSSAKDMVVGSIPLMLLGLGRGSMEYKPTPVEKSFIWDMGDNPDIGKAKIDEAVSKGDITAQDGELRKKAIDNVASLITKVPKETDKGRTLTDRERMDYLYNSVVKDKAKTDSKTLPEKQSLVADKTASVADFKNQFLLDETTDNNLDKRKTQLEKSLIPKKDSEGKEIPINENEKLKTESELQAVNDVIEERKKSDVETPDVLKSPLHIDAKGEVTNVNEIPNTQNISSLKTDNNGENIKANAEANEGRQEVLNSEQNAASDEGAANFNDESAKEKIKTEEQNKKDTSNDISKIANEIRSRNVEGVSKGSDEDVYNYAIDKVAEDPAKFQDQHPELFDKIKDRIPTEKLQENLDFLIKNNPDHPSVDVLDKMISDRESGNENNTGIKKSITVPERTQRSLPPIALPKLGTDAEVLAKGKEDVDSGRINPRDVVQRVNKEKGIFSPEEAAAMLYYKHQLVKAETDLKDEINSHPKDSTERAEAVSKLGQLSDEMDAATEASRINSRAWGNLGNIMQIETDQSFNPSTVRSIIKENYGGEIPKDVQAKIDEALKMRDNAIEELRKAKEDMAAKEINKQAQFEQRNAKRKQTKEDLKGERQSIIEDIKKGIKKDLGNINSGIPIPTATLDAIGKLAVNYFKDGVVTIEGLTDKIYTDLKSFGYDKRAIREAISNYKTLRYEAHDKALDKVEKKSASTWKKITGGDFSEKMKANIAFRKSMKYLEAEKNLGDAESLLKELKRKSFDSQKNMYQKGLAWAGRLIRISVLSGYNVLGKLAAAATIGSAVKRVPEQVIGGVYSKIFKSIAEKAPIEGHFNANAEAKFYKEFFNPKKFAQNAWEIVKTGSSNLTKRHGSGEYEHVPVLYLPTDLHQIIKDPPKRATFEASFRNGLIHAEKDGMDINDPLVINTVENAAYKRALYEIFQESNQFSRFFLKQKAELEKKGNAGATAKFLVDFMIPVSTVPTNLARRMVTTSPLGLIRGAKEVVQAYRKGISNLTNEQADHVMQQLKQGSVGTALWLIGWFGASHFGGLYSQFNPNKKRKEGDKVSDEMDVNGTKIPKPVQHALPLEVIQMAATARRIYDNYKENKNANNAEAIFKAGLGSIGALSEQIPVIETATHASMALKDPVEADKLKDDMKRRFEPQILRETGVIGQKQDKSLPEWKYLDDKGVKVVDLHKESLQPVDKNNNRIKVSDDDFDKVKEERENIIKNNVSELMKNGAIIWSNHKRIAADKLTPDQTKRWLMNKSTAATKEAIDKIFGEQPEKPKAATVDTYN